MVSVDYANIGITTSLLPGILMGVHCMSCSGQRLDMDVKWQGSSVVHMLRVHGQNGDEKQGQTVLHVAGVVAHRGTNPIQLHYASLLLQVLAVAIVVHQMYILAILGSDTVL